MSDGSPRSDALVSAIAVVGMSGRFPDARNVDEFWRNIRDGRESVRALSDDQLLAAGVPRALLENPNYVKSGVELQDMEKFDAGFFGFSPLDASIMDPQHRHFLECCWEALESAGCDPERFDGAIGVYAGSGHNAYLASNLLTNPELVDQVGFFLLRHTGNDKDFLSTRVSYQFDLKGPSVNVQTACSTSLVAVHWACQSLLANECDMALAGGVTIELPHGRGYVAREGEILSPDGHCRPFEERSNGTLFGSGVGVVVLRRLEDALEDRDPVLAVIRGSAINNDGSGKVGYLAPSVDGQASAIAEALDIAGIDADTVGLLEAHGTGTAVGDPIEVAALTQAFGDTEQKRYCALSSVKSNIGHTDTAAGVASLIKAIQSLRARQLPPTLHFERPNPEIDFESTPFYVNAELRDWPREAHPRRAGVSSLGVGGTNAHVVVEEFETAPAPAPRRALQLVPLSARSEAALDNATDRLADYLRDHPDASLADTAFTLQVGRRGFEQRRVFVASDNASLTAALDAREGVSGTLRSQHPAVTFMFPGGGAQYPNMGRGLYETEPVYRHHVDSLLSALEPALEAQLRALLFPAAGHEAQAAAELQRPSLQLPLIFVTEYALAQLWKSWGVEPDALIGHSMGENTAACLAGVFAPRDALALVSLRGRLFERVPAGGMLSISLPAAEVEPLLGPELCLASINAPELCAASGPVEALEALERELATREVPTQRVRIDVAAHSAMLDPILDEWNAFLGKLELSEPQIPFISNLTGDWITAEEATDPRYWVRHLRSPVRFADGVALLLELPDRALLEIGPGRTLAALAGMQANPERSIHNSMRHPDDASGDAEFALSTLGRLWIDGLDVDWEALHGDDLRQRVALPTYPFEHQRHWVEPGRTLYEEGAVEAGLERRDDIGDWIYAPAWRATPAPAQMRPEAVLVFSDDSELSAQLISTLAETGSDVVTVRAGGRFERASRDEFAIRAANPDDCDALFATLGGENRIPNAIAQLWSAGAEDTSLASYEGARDRGFGCLLAIAQGIASQDWSDPLRIVSVTRGVQQVAGEIPTDPIGGLNLGACSVIANEFPNVSCRSVDLEDGSDGEAALRLAGELAGDPSDRGCDDVIAYRGTRRLARSFEPVDLRAASDATPLREHGVYLITGGLGGLGGVLAEHLAKQVQARLVLLGRRALPERESWAAWLEERPETDWTSRRIREIEALEAAGAEVWAVGADVCDAPRMREVVVEARERFGALHGVIHTAGVLDDQLIALKTLEDAERVLAPKVRGTLALAQALEDSELDFFALYSSLSAIAGLPGQIDYSAANAFLDAFARSRSGDACHTVSIGWGPWRDVGMAADLARGDVDESMSIDHPLLECDLGPRGACERYATQFSTSRHWLVDEHRLASGDALVPGTGYLELARAALENRREAGAVELRDVFLAAPFMVPDGPDASDSAASGTAGSDTADGSRELRIEFDRASGDFAFLSGSRDSDAAVEHVRGAIAHLEDAGPPVHDLDAIRTRCSDRRVTFEGPPEPVHLRFGPRWSCIHSVDFGDGEALAELIVPGAYADELESLWLHPAALDMATGCAFSLWPELDAEREFCVPMSYSRVVSRAALPGRFFAHIRYRSDGERDSEFGVFDVALVDVDGTEIACFEEFVVKRVAGGSQLAAAAVESAVGTLGEESGDSAFAERLAEAARPAEALDAFDRLLRAGSLENAIVLPQDLQRWVERAVEPVGAGAPSAASKVDPQLQAELTESEGILSRHPAVAEAVITAHFDRPGQTRLLAHVVWESDVHATVSELRKFLRGELPDDRLPQNIVDVDEFPRDSEGRVERANLDDPFGMADDHVDPRSDTERAIAKIWRETLRIDRVGVYDNFFDIGGHSLLAMRAILKTEKKVGVRLNNAIMVLQTLEQVAAECDKRRPPERDAATFGAVAPDGDEPGAPAASLTSRLMRAVRGKSGR
jgi:acyl transferase domain-containing protein